MRINDLVGETTEYDKKLKVELRKPKAGVRVLVLLRTH